MVRRGMECDEQGLAEGYDHSRTRKVWREGGKWIEGRIGMEEGRWTGGIKRNTGLKHSYREKPTMSIFIRVRPREIGRRGKRASAGNIWHFHREAIERRE